MSHDVPEGSDAPVTAAIKIGSGTWARRDCAGTNELREKRDAELRTRYASERRTTRRRSA